MPESRHYPFLILVMILLIAGMFVYEDYGLSRDEPLYYAYGAAVPYAYSIAARTEGNFDIELAYGPSADHKLYGPIYLLLARPLVQVLSQVTGYREIEPWHLVNFLVFLIGVVLLYKLSLRWLKPEAALFTALLYATQPLLWGHAFINPKDNPFATFFILSIYLSFKLVDVLSAPGSLEVVPSADAIQAGWPRIRRWVMIAGGSGLLALILFFGLEAWLQTLIGRVILAVYEADPASWVGRGFTWLAPNAGSVSVDAYVQKALVLFAQVQKGILLLGLPLVILGGLTAIFSSPLLRFFTAWETSPYGPLPRLPSWNSRYPSKLGLLLAVLGGLVLGASTTLRILAPLAGVLAFLYFMLRSERRPIFPWLIYGLAALLGLYCTWPFLWEAPFSNFFEVLTHMSFNPKSVPVLFDGVVYPSLDLPRTYLPKILSITLTEPTWPLALVGLGALIFAWWRKRNLRQESRPEASGEQGARSWIPLLAWFGIPFAYVLLRRPPMYDGFRHFLFILPPVFILAGLGFQAASQKIKSSWIKIMLMVALTLPGVIGIGNLHPYQYTYYNSLVGGVRGAFRQFETDYWLTCYKELVTQINQQVPDENTIFVLREPSIVSAYADARFSVERFEPEKDQTFPGSLLLLTTRSNRDLEIHFNDPLLLQVEHEGAVFCLLREVK